MKNIKKIIKARKKMRALLIKQERIFTDLLDQLGKKDPEDTLACDLIFEYLYSGTNHHLNKVKEKLNNG